MPFISLSDEAAKKSYTSLENKFITKYLPVLEPMAVKVYLYALYACQSGAAVSDLSDFAEKLQITEDDAKNYFQYLEEFELVSILSLSPFEVRILSSENIAGAPKKIKPEKYADFTKAVQNVLKGRMISPSEFREYFYLLDEYGFEQNALVMIINYCVNMRGDDIRFAYIKKVARSFGDEGITTAKQVDERLSAYTSSTPSLLKIFSAAGIRRQPDIDDDAYFNKWTKKLGFDEDAIICAARLNKPKSIEKLDETLEALSKCGKFDIKEIADYHKNRNAMLDLTREIGKNLGIYMQNAATFADNYVNVWINFGYSPESLKKLSEFALRHEKMSFESMNDMIGGLFEEGIISDGSVDGYLKKMSEEDKIIKTVISECGLTRRISPWDRQSLARWRSWNFSDKMLVEAARLSSGKSNPMAYMNGILSSWKSEGISSPENIPQKGGSAVKNPAENRQGKDLRAIIEEHYAALRHAAEDRAERAVEKAESDPRYAQIKRQLNELTIKLAFEEIKGGDGVKKLNEQIAALEVDKAQRLKELGLNESDLSPRYLCESCRDTGYLNNGAPCDCLKRYLKSREI